MFETDFLSSDAFRWVILPLFIFLSRVVDVSMGTLRVMFISRGFHKIAPFVGFFELLLWLVAIGQIMQNLTNVAAYVAYAGGFATGTYVGMFIERKLSLGMVIVRVITKTGTGELIERLREKNYGITIVDAEGSRGSVKLIFTVLKRKNVSEMLSLLQQHQPKAFYTIEDVRYTSEGVFPAQQQGTNIDFLRKFTPARKGK